MSSPLLKIDVRHVSKTFHRRQIDSPIPALRDVSLQVIAGEFVCLVGPSGCGKTTLLRLIHGLLEAARSFGARRGQMFRFIMLPAALPYIVTGLRLGGANAMVGTVIAELYTALSGLGYLIAQFGGTFQTAKYFGPVLVLAAMGMVISQTLKMVERRLARWKSTQTEL